MLWLRFPLVRPICLLWYIFLGVYGTLYSKKPRRNSSFRGRRKHGVGLGYVIMHFLCSGVASSKVWECQTIFLCWWAVKVTINIHGTPRYPYIYQQKTFQLFRANLERGLNICGYGPTHSPWLRHLCMSYDSKPGIEPATAVLRANSTRLCTSRTSCSIQTDIGFTLRSVLREIEQLMQLVCSDLQGLNPLIRFLSSCRELEISTIHLLGWICLFLFSTYYSGRFAINILYPITVSLRLFVVIQTI